MLSRLKRLLFILILGGTLSAGTLLASEVLEELDYLHFFDEHQEILSILDSRPPANAAERGQLRWRRARAMVSIANLSSWEGTMSDSDAIDLLERAQENADEAISLLPDEPEPYFWRAAATGQRAQLRGVLNSLFLASDVRDYAAEALSREEDLAEAYYLLGQVYRELPGWPVSFGNDNYAVSLARRAVALYEEKVEAGEVPVAYHDHYTQLADALWQRNNNTRRRERNHRSAAADFRSASTALERGFYYEGTVSIPDQSDREEALEIIRGVVRQLSRISDKTLRNRMDLEEAQELLDAWE